MIDNISRVMIINFYHKYNHNVHYVLQLPLTNLMVTWNEQYDKMSGSVKDADTSLKGYNELFFRVYKQIN